MIVRIGLRLSHFVLSVSNVHRSATLSEITHAPIFGGHRFIKAPNS